MIVPLDYFTCLNIVQINTALSIQCHLERSLQTVFLVIIYNKVTKRTLLKNKSI